MRKYSRFLAQDDAFAMLENRVVKVRNISKGGLSFEYLSDNGGKEAAFKLDIFLSENGFHISDLPCRTVYNISVSKPYIYQTFSQTFTARQCGVEFVELCEEKISQLNFFLKNCTLGLA